MSFQDVVFLKLWMWVNKGMLPVKYNHSNKSSFCVSLILEDDKTVTTLR